VAALAAAAPTTAAVPATTAVVATGFAAYHKPARHSRDHCRHRRSNSHWHSKSRCSLRSSSWIASNPDCCWQTIASNPDCCWPMIVDYFGCYWSSTKRFAVDCPDSSWLLAGAAPDLRPMRPVALAHPVAPDRPVRPLRRVALGHRRPHLVPRHAAPGPRLHLARRGLARRRHRHDRRRRQSFRHWPDPAWRSRLRLRLRRRARHRHVARRRPSPGQPQIQRPKRSNRSSSTIQVALS